MCQLLEESLNSKWGHTLNVIVVGWTTDDLECAIRSEGVLAIDLGLAAVLCGRASPDVDALDTLFEIGNLRYM